MLIKVLSVTIEKVPTAKGSYEKAAVAYKDKDGKIQGKNIVSFVHKPVFEAIKVAQQGDEFEVTNEKIGDNWNWTAISKLDGTSTGSSAPAPSKPTSSGNSSPKSTYETPEERAARQVLIVRQSSLSSAILFAKELKAIKTKEEVVDLAKYFEAYVFNTHYDNGTIDGLPNSDINFDDDGVK